MRSVRGVMMAMAMALGCAAAQRGEGLDVAAIPPPMREDYALFADRCSRCHSIARPLTARVDDLSHWTQYVARMRRQPGAMISEAEGARIVRFLVWFHDDSRDGGVR